jgi:titin
VLACAGQLIGLAQAAFANGVRSGDALPIDPHTLAPVASGGSATAWTLNLPPQASCSGDSATQGYHVYSFLVPSPVDPGTLTFNPSTGPSSGFPLVDNTGSPYLAANTAAVTGQIVQIPTFNFNLFASTTQGGTKLATPPGNYRYGIACADTNGRPDRYWDRVLTFTASGGDPNGETWTTAAVPGAPTIGTAVAGMAQATVSWTAPASDGGAPITGYVVTPYIGAVAQPATPFNNTATTHTVGGLTNGTTYTFTVAAVNGIGTGPQSGASNTAVPGITPGAPTVGTAVAGMSQATVSWTAPVSNGGPPITAYVVTAYVGFNPVMNVIAGPNATSRTVSGLTNGTTYRFRVSAVNAAGASDYSKASNTAVPGIVPGAPTVGTAVAGMAQATVSWTAPASNGGPPITAYVVTAYVGFNPVMNVIAGPNATSRTVSGLTNGTTYRFRVSAVNAAGASDYSKASNAVIPSS